MGGIVRLCWVLLLAAAFLANPVWSLREGLSEYQHQYDAAGNAIRANETQSQFDDAGNDLRPNRTRDPVLDQEVAAVIGGDGDVDAATLLDDELADRMTRLASSTDDGGVGEERDDL